MRFPRETLSRCVVFVSNGLINQRWGRPGGLVVRRWTTEPYASEVRGFDSRVGQNFVHALFSVPRPDITIVVERDVNCKRTNEKHGISGEPDGT